MFRRLYLWISETLRVWKEREKTVRSDICWSLKFKMRNYSPGGLYDRIQQLWAWYWGGETPTYLITCGVGKGVPRYISPCPHTTYITWPSAGYTATDRFLCFVLVWRQHAGVWAEEPWGKLLNTKLAAHQWGHVAVSGLHLDSCWFKVSVGSCEIKIWHDNLVLCGLNQQSSRGQVSKTLWQPSLLKWTLNSSVWTVINQYSERLTTQTEVCIMDLLLSQDNSRELHSRIVLRPRGSQRKTGHDVCKYGLRVVITRHHW